MCYQARVEVLARVPSAARSALDEAGSIIAAFGAEQTSELAVFFEATRAIVLEQQSWKHDGSDFDTSD